MPYRMHPYKKHVNDNKNSKQGKKKIIIRYLQYYPNTLKKKNPEYSLLKRSKCRIPYLDSHMSYLPCNAVIQGYHVTLSILLLFFFFNAYYHSETVTLKFNQMIITLPRIRYVLPQRRDPYVLRTYYVATFLCLTPVLYDLNNI